MQIDVNGSWQGKRILIVSPEAWGPLRLSKHHYATSLMEQGADVFFLDPDGSLLKTLCIHPPHDGAPTIVKRPRPFRGMRFLPRPLRAFLEARQMKRLASACGGAFDMLWNFDLYRFRSLINRSHAHVRIVHAMDLRRPLDLQEPGAHADLVIVVSPGMAEALGKDSERVMVLPHAWMPRKKAEFNLPDLGPGIKVGYLGNLAIPFIDWDSVLAMAEAHPHVQFHLMGPLGGAFGNSTTLDHQQEQCLRTLPNVHLHGSIAYERIPNWLEAMDVLLVPYDSARFAGETAHPHKVLEYLASGKVIVSSFLKDYKYLEEVIVMALPGEVVTPLLETVLDNLDYHNSQTMQDRRKAIAESHSYRVALERSAHRLAAISSE